MFNYLNLFQVDYFDIMSEDITQMVAASGSKGPFFEDTSVEGGWLEPYFYL